MIESHPLTVAASIVEQNSPISTGDVDGCGSVVGSCGSGDCGSGVGGMHSGVGSCGVGGGKVIPEEGRGVWVYQQLCYKHQGRYAAS